MMPATPQIDPAEGHVDFFKSRAADHTQQANTPGLSSTQRAASRDDAWVASQAAKNWSKKTNKANGL